MPDTLAPGHDDTCDVLVIGGGPAGSTIAALLAQRGERVVLVEKDHHPRFHIGESLLPFNMPLLDALGVKAEVAQIGIPKFGVEFVAPDRPDAVMLEFANAWDKNFPGAFEVRRSVFDHILLRNAATRGAMVIEGCRVLAVDFPPDGGVVARAEDEAGTPRLFKARFLVDASGRDTLLANRMEIKQRNPHNATAAVFGHFTGAKRLPGRAEGNISIFWFQHGWFWFIPLSDGTTSVGAVCTPDVVKARKTDVTSFLHSLIAMCPALTARLSEATLVEPATATGNYSYSATRMSGERFIMVGDAFAFIDPVFSSGVYLAMKSAFLGADAVTACLHTPAEGTKARAVFEAKVGRGLRQFSWFIYRINRPAMRELLLVAGNRWRLKEAVLSVLAGDVFGHSRTGAHVALFKAIYYIRAFMLAAGSRLSRTSPART